MQILPQPTRTPTQRPQYAPQRQKTAPQSAPRRKSCVKGYAITFIAGLIFGVTLQNGMLSQFLALLAALTGGAQ